MRARGDGGEQGIKAYWKAKGWHTHRLRETEAAYPETAFVCLREGHRAARRGGHSSIPTPKAVSNGKPLKNENRIIFYEGVLTWKETTLKDRPNAQQKMNAMARLEGLWFTVLSRGPSFLQLYRNFALYHGSSFWVLWDFCVSEHAYLCIYLNPMCFLFDAFFLFGHILICFFFYLSCYIHCGYVGAFVF